MRPGARRRRPAGGFSPDLLLSERPHALQVVSRVPVIRLEPEGLRELGPRLGQPADPGEQAAEIVVDVGGARLEAEGLVEFPDRLGNPPQSEERRVGKECRSRWAPY